MEDTCSRRVQHLQVWCRAAVCGKVGASLALKLPHQPTLVLLSTQLAIDIIPPLALCLVGRH